MKEGFKVGPCSADKSRREGRGGRRELTEGVQRVILERGAGGESTDLGGKESAPTRGS